MQIKKNFLQLIRELGGFDFLLYQSSVSLLAHQSLKSSLDE